MCHKYKLMDTKEVDSETMKPPDYAKQTEPNLRRPPELKLVAPYIKNDKQLSSKAALVSSQYFTSILPSQCRLRPLLEKTRLQRVLGPWMRLQNQLTPFPPPGSVPKRADNSSFVCRNTKISKQPTLQVSARILRAAGISINSIQLQVLSITTA